jgi:hypothetical protein
MAELFPSEGIASLADAGETVTFGPEYPIVLGGDGNDRITHTNDADQVNGDEGDDFIEVRGAENSVLILGGLGSDEIIFDDFDNLSATLNISNQLSRSDTDNDIVRLGAGVFGDVQDGFTREITIRDFIDINDKLYIELPADATVERLESGTVGTRIIVNGETHVDVERVFRVTDNELVEGENLFFVGATPDPSAPGPNTAPSAVADNFTTTEGSSQRLNVLSNDSDPDGDTLVVSEIFSVPNGAVRFNNDGTLQYFPNEGFEGLDQFIYRVADVAGGTADAQVTVIVNPDNDPSAGSVGLTGVARFFNTDAGGHFFTIDPNEESAVRSNLSETFRPEGDGFFAFSEEVEDGVPVYRFFNTEAGGHFFTTDASERDFVLNNLPQFNFEGVGFYGFAGEISGALPVYRFFNTEAGGHFFTINEQEKEFVQQNLPQYNFEGVGFYAFEDDQALVGTTYTIDDGVL